MKRPVKRNPSDLERALAGDKKLKGADLRGVDLQFANLEGADLRGADLRGADLVEADLRGAQLAEAKLAGAQLAKADLTEADLYRADISRANLAGADISRANLTDARLLGANLAKADFTDAMLHHANLAEADLTEARLHRAALVGANLTGADLAGAVLVRAYLYLAKLVGAYLGAANFDYADLTEANLHSANLSGAGFFEANLTEANLIDAKLRGTKFIKTNLTEAKLIGAYFERTHLAGSNLTGANLAGANLAGANLAGVNLAGANLTGANLAEADLTETDLTGTNLTGADLTGAKLPPKARSKPAKSYGRMTGPILKAHKSDAPSRAADFKKQYPAEFERLKADTQGRDFTPTLRQTLKAKYETPFEWFITLGKYERPTQRYCPEPNDVIKFNLDLDDPQYTKRQKAFLSKLRAISNRSGHPVEMLPYFTVGWVRLCVNDRTKTVLIEEVQSDVSVVRKKLKDGSVPGLEEYADVIDTFAPIAERFYVDAIGYVFIEAEAKGYSVEMLNYPAKVRFGSPRELYTDLPKSMGMKLTPSQQILGIDSTWYYKPNPKKRARSKRRV